MLRRRHLLLTLALFLAPLGAQADTFSFPSSGTLTGMYQAAPSTQNVVPFAIFESFSANGFTFTGLFGDPFGKSNPGGDCFAGTSGSNCVLAQLVPVGNPAQAAAMGGPFFINSGPAYLAIPSMADKSGTFGYSQVMVITNNAGTAFSLQSFNGAQVLPPNFTGGFHRNSASIFWQAALDGGGTATGNCLFPADNGPMTCNVNENDITSLTLIAVNAGGLYDADWGMTSWDGSTSPAGSTVPEPGTLEMLGLGLIAVAGQMRMRAITHARISE